MKKLRISLLATVLFIQSYILPVKAIDLDLFQGEWKGNITTENSLDPAQAVEIINTSRVIKNQESADILTNNELAQTIVDLLQTTQSNLNNLNETTSNDTIQNLNSASSNAQLITQNLSGQNNSKINTSLINKFSELSKLINDVSGLIEEIDSAKASSENKKDQRIYNKQIRKISKILKKLTRAAIILKNKISKTDSSNPGSGENNSINQGPKTLSPSDTCKLQLDICNDNGMITGIISGAFNGVISNTKETSDGSLAVDFNLTDASGNTTDTILKILITPFTHGESKMLSLLIQNGLIVELNREVSTCPLPKTFTNPLGVASPPIIDTSAFATCP